MVHNSPDWKRSPHLTVAKQGDCGEEVAVEHPRNGVSSSETVQGIILNEAFPAAIGVGAAMALSGASFVHTLGAGFISGLVFVIVHLLRARS